jgi:Macrocin-O-methyltransferase (TylF)
MFDTPILFLIFNRPKHAQAVLKRIRELKPTKLFIVADGPRNNNTDDQVNCKLTRDTVMEMINWECQVKTLLREENLGCGVGPADGITWFFNQVEQGIILEDDCLPDISFFTFCENMLSRYKTTPEVMHISGNNFQDGIARGKHSYYFSAYTHNWGWATWHDRWALFDFEMNGYSNRFVHSISSFYKFTNDEVLFWQKSFDNMVSQHRVDIWDFRWMYSVWKNRGVSVLPQINLVKNIGFDQQATHTYIMADNIQHMTAGEIKNIEHPSSILLNRDADKYSLTNHFNPRKEIVRRMVDLLIRGFKKTVSLIVLPIKLEMQFARFKNYTMIPKSLYKANLELIWKFRRVRGSIVECGTWKGGMIGGMVNILGKNKRYYLFDSFEGLPEVKEIDGIAAKLWQSDETGASYFDNCTADEEEARKAMQLSGATYFEITKGWFNDTLRSFSPPNGISILRLDADWYDSTMECLVNLFPKVAEGGIVILDDYYTWEGCSKALHDYLSTNKLPYRIHSHKGICYVIKR